MLKKIQNNTLLTHLKITLDKYIQSLKKHPYTHHNLAIDKITGKKLTRNTSIYVV